jgi:hypothetical protein
MTRIPPYRRLSPFKINTDKRVPKEACVADEKKVVAFPRPYQGPPPTKEDAQVVVGLMVEEFVEEVLDFLGPMVFDQLKIAGVKCDDPSLITDFTMIHESIKSLMLKNWGEYHPLQSVAEEIFDPAKDNIKIEININGKATAEFLP